MKSMGKRNRKQRQVVACIMGFLLTMVIGFVGAKVGEDITMKQSMLRHVNHKANGMSLEGLELKDVDVSEQVVRPIARYIKTSMLGQLSTSTELLKQQLASEYAILVRESDGMILLDKYATEQMYPASMTKLMTALVAIEQIENLEEEILLSSYIFDIVREANASIAGFEEEEMVKAIDLIYGTILPSGGECSLALAEHIAGSEGEFVKLMNKKAAELGMENTKFSNSTGLHDENHYSTAYDIVLLLQACLDNMQIKTILSTEEYVSSPTNKHENGIVMSSTLLTRLKGIDETSSICGGKTGYTSDAGLCLASYASIAGENYLLVTSAALGNNRTKQQNIYDAVWVYGFLEAF